MKKGLLITAILCLSTVLMAQENVDEPSNAKGAHPYKLEENTEVAPEFSHWSLIGHVGFSTADADYTSEMSYSVGLPSAGLNVEYAFTPVWGMGVEYMFSWYNVSGALGHADTLLNGYMHKAGVYLSMDLMNLIFPNLEKKILSIHPFIGGGAAWYKRNKYFLDDYYYDARKGKDINWTHQRGMTLEYINAAGEVGRPEFDTVYKFMPYMQAGVNVEFNVSRTLAVGARVAYSYFTADYLDGRGYHKGYSAHASKNNDGLLDVTLTLRYKIEPEKYTHERNINRKNQYVKVEPCYVHDTLIIQHDSIIVRETFEHMEMQKELEQYYYVYFENNKAVIDDKGLITIQQVAERLQEDSTLYAVVTGYCDNTGSNKLNYALGDKRASNVVDELAQEHAIDTARMYGMGMGKIIGRRSTASYSPNRRAAIRLVDKDTFERMKLNLDEERANREEEVQTIPLTESARPEKVNEYQLRSNEEVKTNKSTTLSKLARQYYNNTYCWVYIYIANKEKIKNPNALNPGTKLIIPELTAEEMRITKDESLVLFQNARK